MDAGIPALDLGNNTTLITCPDCLRSAYGRKASKRRQEPFSAPFHGIRVDPCTGQEVPLTHDRLPNVAESFTAEEAEINTESLRAYYQHYGKAHPKVKFKV